MSVPVNRRSEGKLDVNTKTLELCKYTLQITANEKYFPPEQQSFTEKLRETAIDIHCLCWEANNIRVDKNADRARQRVELEARAVDKCNTLCALLNIAKPLFHLASKRVMYWTNLTVETRNLISAWRDADVKRYSLYAGH